MIRDELREDVEATARELHIKIEGRIRDTVMEMYFDDICRLAEEWYGCNDEDVVEFERVLKELNWYC